MATVVPQPPPMAYNPQPGTDRFSPLAAALNTKLQQPRSSATHGASPFSPVSSTHPNSPKSPSLDSHRALDGAISGKSSFSSTSSGPASPASMTYSPAVQSALRDSCRSSTSSHLSAMASPHPLNSKGQRDLEKQQIPARSNRQIPSDRTTTAHYHASSYGMPDADDDEEDLKAEDKAVSILVCSIHTPSLAARILIHPQLYLSGPNCLVSFVILLYTFLALFATILLQPFRLCTHGASFRQQIIGFLGPTLRIQLNFIYSSYSSEQYSAPMLVVVNLLAPLLSLGVIGGAWIAAAFWFFNAILGDPDGSDKPKGYNDGRASVMGVRKWWEKWLRRPLR